MVHFGDDNAENNGGDDDGLLLFSLHKRICSITVNSDSILTEDDEHCCA